MHSAQFAQKLLRYEGRLYSESIEMQIWTLQDVKNELDGKYNHQSLIDMLAKYFSYTNSLFQRIKIIEIIQQKLPTLINSVQNWKLIIEHFQQDCFSSNYQLRILSLIALNTIMPVLKEQYNTFHIGIFEIFLNSTYPKELYIASQALLNSVKNHFSYSFMNKIQTIPEIKIFKTKKLTMLLKCILVAKAQFYLYEAPILDFLNTVKQQLSNVCLSKDYIHLLYNYVKVAQNFKEQEQQIIQFLSRQDLINLIGQSTEKIQELFKTIFKQYKLDFKVVYYEFGNIYSKKNIIEQIIQFDHLINYLENLQTYDIIQFLDLFFYAYDFACNEIVKTVSVQTEQKLIQVLIKLDTIVLRLFTKQVTDEVKPFSFRNKCLQKLIILSVQLYQAQISFTKLKEENSLECIISLITAQKNSYLCVICLKLLYSINQKELAQQIIASMQCENSYTEVYLAYIQSLQDFNQFLNWNDFQINSTQHFIRKEIINYYQNFDQLLQEIEEQEIDSNNAMSLFDRVTNLIHQTTILSAKIEFFSNQAYAEDATFLQFIILDKINLCLQRNYLDLEVESLNYENSNLIIQKLIEYNKCYFIKKFLPNLRKDKLKDFIRQMRNSIYNYPKILLQLIQTPSIEVDCTQIDYSGQHALVRFNARLISQIIKQDVKLILKYSINNFETVTIDLPMREQQATLNVVVEINSKIEFILQSQYYQGIIVLETEEKVHIVTCLQN